MFSIGILWDIVVGTSNDFDPERIRLKLTKRLVTCFAEDSDSIYHILKVVEAVHIQLRGESCVSRKLNHLLKKQNTSPRRKWLKSAAHAKLIRSTQDSNLEPPDP